MSQTEEQVVRALYAAVTLDSRAVVLRSPGFRVAVRTNSQSLLEHLCDYYRGFEDSGGGLGAGAGAAARNELVEIAAVESPAVRLALDFEDWKRGPGKSVRKDAYADLGRARVVRKVRTGMVFFQSQAERIVCGPCLEHANQVINFINSQFMSYWQQQGAVLCHAAAARGTRGGLAVAGFSGGGKSTTLLNLLEQPGTQFVTNDRLLLKEKGSGVLGIGVPKMPRVNPGTLLHHPRLRSRLSAAEIARWSALPRDELWELEEKHDLDIPEAFGPHRVSAQATLENLLILNWSREAAEPCTVHSVDLRERRDLLQTITKSPGPFYQRADGTFQSDNAEIVPEPYLSLLTRVNNWEVRGTVDFSRLLDHCRLLIGEPSCSEKS